MKRHLNANVKKKGEEKEKKIRVELLWKEYHFSKVAVYTNLYKLSTLSSLSKGYDKTIIKLKGQNKTTPVFLS